MINLSIWVLLLPLLGFLILGILGRSFSRTSVLVVAWGACSLAFVCAAISFLSMLGTASSARIVDSTIYMWVSSGTFQLNFGLLYDPLSATLLMIITGVGLLIHIYSAGYMEDDPGFWRFFAYLNFFIFSMVLLVLADNFLFLLVGWGMVGLASFLLIGFWYQRSKAVAAAQKAFVINVIGDVGLMLAIFLIFINFGTLNYQSVFSKVSGASTGALTAICLLLFVACAAKSAQLPLYMWLPDAMEGPTPVSALIHAATMVTAGVYLVARTNILFSAAPIALNVVASIGGATALFAATIALFQLDIKRVLAYSTISQLGYMFLGEGAGNYGSGIFHLTTHAYFKALLFLGAGAVIHALGGEQDMRKMGGLRRKLPITFATFLIAALAISGIFPLAGFWSKDEILGSMLAQATATGNIGYYVLWLAGILTAGLTAFYMFRLFFGIFLGTYRGSANGAQVDDEEDETGGHAGNVRYSDVHEVEPLLWIPLVILAVLSVIGGFAGSLGLFGAANWHPLAGFLGATAPTLEPSLAIEWTSTGLSLAIALVGIFAAYALYRRGFEYKENNNPLYLLVLDKYRVDEGLSLLLLDPILAFSRAASQYLEGDTLDGGARGFAFLFRGAGTGLRRLQTGYMRNYALAILLGAVLIVVYFAVRG